jgi:hypothetical protein
MRQSLGKGGCDGHSVIEGGLGDVLDSDVCRHSEVEVCIIFSNKQGVWIPYEGGAPGEGRTHDLQLRRLSLYPSELRAHGCVSQEGTGIAVTR